jgi:hypothetical protein
MEENWQPAERVQANEQGQYRALIGGEWVPVERAQKNDAGQFRVLMPSSEKPSGAQRIAGNPITRFAIGAADPIMGAVQLGANLFGLGDKELEIPNPFNKDVPLYRSSVNEHIKGLDQQIEAGRGKDAGFDAARLGGNILSPVNAAVAKVLPAATTVAGRAATGAAAGGGSAALMPVTGDDYFGEKGAQVAGGAVTGGIATPIIGKLVDTIAPKVANLVTKMQGGPSTVQLAQNSLQTDLIIEQALKEIGATGNDVPPQMLQGIRQQVNEALRAGKKLDAAAQFRKQDFEGLGVKPMLGQITRDPTQFAMEKNLRSADPRLATASNEQTRALAERLRGFGANGAVEAPIAGDEFVGHLAGVDKQLGSQVSDSYKAARAAVGRDMEIPVSNLAQDMAKIKRDFGSKIPDAVISRLDEFGVFSGKPQKILDMNEAEDILQQLNKLKGSDNGTNNALTAINKAVKNAIMEADDQGGVFAVPRNLAAQRFKLHDMVPALRAAAEGDASADKFVGQYLLRGETKDVKALADLLKKTSPELYDQARSQFGQEIVRAAYGENAAGDKALRPEMLAKALRQFGPKRLEAFFSQSEIDQMNRAARVGAYMESIPAGSPVNTSNSLTAALPFLAKIPGADKVAAVLKAGAAIGSGLRNANTVNNAVRAEVPATAAELSPQAKAALARALMMGAGGVGMAAVQP